MICKACGNINKSTQSIFSLRCQKCGGELILFENAWFGTRDTKLLKNSFSARYIIISALIILSFLVTNIFHFIIVCATVVPLFYLSIFMLAKIRDHYGYVKHGRGIKESTLSKRTVFIEGKGELRWIEKKLDLSLFIFLLLAIAVVLYDVSQLYNCA